MEGSWFSQFRHGSNPWMARYIYGLIFLVANLLAWAIRDYGPNILSEMRSKIFFFFFSAIVIRSTTKNADLVRFNCRTKGMQRRDQMSGSRRSS